jgi:hypothetical protein
VVIWTTILQNAHHTLLHNTFEFHENAISPF